MATIYSLEAIPHGSAGAEQVQFKKEGFPVSGELRLLAKDIRNSIFPDSISNITRDDDGIRLTKVKAATNERTGSFSLKVTIPPELAVVGCRVVFHIPTAVAGQSHKITVSNDQGEQASVGGKAKRQGVFCALHPETSFSRLDFVIDDGGVDGLGGGPVGKRVIITEIVFELRATS